MFSLRISITGVLYREVQIPVLTHTHTHTHTHTQGDNNISAAQIQKCAAMKRTKRNLLSVSVSIFDPLGMISPVTARITTIFQLLCEDKRDWDDEITAEVGLVWAKFLQELTDLKEVRVQRLVWSGISRRQKSGVARFQ